MARDVPDEGREVALGGDRNRWEGQPVLDGRPRQDRAGLVSALPGRVPLDGMPTEPMPPTLAAVLDRAADVCDPTAENDGVADLVARFEDRDEPITAVADVEQEIAEARGAVDPQEEDPQVVMTAAVAVYLAHRRTEIADGRETLLRLAARAEFDGRPPESVAGWLAAQGVEP